MLEGSFRLTSPFGYKSDPATGRHVLLGLDMAAPLGTPIVAIADGKVEKVDVYGGAGRVIIFHKSMVYQHSHGIYTCIKTVFLLRRTTC